MALGKKTLDDLLNPISRQLGRDCPPDNIDLPTWEAVPVRATDGLSQEELVNMFVDEAQKVRVSVHRCTPFSLASCISDIIAEGEAGSVVCGADDRFSTAGLRMALEALPNAESVTVWDPSLGEENVKAAHDARYGITYASGGIAETGTIVQPTGPRCGRAVSLLPLVHIAVIDADTIMGTMADVMKSWGGHGELPAQLCFISGPSATADIELVRVEGVHGPMYVHYVVVE